MKVDYIVVGSGLAGINFCHLLKQNNKTFMVVDNASQMASTIAAGLFNPVVLKRFTPVWKSRELLRLALPVYKKLEEELSIKLIHHIPVLRLFHSVEEQNNWFVASDKYGLQQYMFSEIIKNTNRHINAPFGFGKVLQTGRIDTKTLQSTCIQKLKEDNAVLEETFQYDAIQFKGECIQYKDIEAKHLVFAEGFGLKQNPFFNHLPLNGTKGELMTISAPDLKLDVVLKSSVFLIPQGNNLYRVGATYNRTDKTNQPTKDAKTELLEKLKSIINCPFKLVKQTAGIRPTVNDRRPLVGQHPEHKNFYVLNGFGSRGVMIAPYASKQLYGFIENGSSLDKDIDINRFPFS